MEFDNKIERNPPSPAHAHTPKMRSAGLILCGGNSSRMGKDKAWLQFEGETLLDRCVREVRAVVDLVVVAAAPGQKLPDLPAETLVVRDDVKGQGPLRGLAVGLRNLRDHAEIVFVASCDVPGLRAEVARYLLDAIGDADAAIPMIDDRRHPLTAAYRVSIVELVEEQLRLGRWRMTDLCDRLDVRQVEAAELRRVDPDLRSFVNVNTREDYARFQANRSPNTGR